jgi:aspartate/methionine/tyrosine aminotransferase
MNLPPFLLDRWLEQYAPKTEFNFAPSTGPVWTLGQLLGIAEGDLLGQLLDTRITYTHSRGMADLRAAIAGLEGVDPDEIQVVTGASEALLILCFLAAGPDANVVVPSPGFPSNKAVPASFGIAVREYRLRPENEFRLDREEVCGLVDGNTRFVLVNSPHNPTGSVVSDADLETLHDFCVARRVQLVVDQVYHPIYHGAAARSAARLPGATVISDFSKALCLSGLRIGWMVERDSDRRANYTNARNYFTITNGVLNERLAVAAIEHSQAIYARAQEVASNNLALLDEVFARYENIVCWHRPQGGMIAFPWLASEKDSRDFCVRLAERGVLIVPGDCFEYPSHFRVGFAASGERFAAGLEIFEGFLRQEAALTTTA